MKEVLPVLIKEAKQISIGNNSKFYGIELGLFDIHRYTNLYFKEDTFHYEKYWSLRLDNDNLYKDYEWRLTPINKLTQGDICKLINGANKCCDRLFVYDRYVNFNEIKTHFFWSILDNRPSLDTTMYDVFKLFKKAKVD